jgi:hypothetical protein
MVNASTGFRDLGGEPQTEPPGVSRPGDVNANPAPFRRGGSQERIEYL